MENDRLAKGLDAEKCARNRLWQNDLRKRMFDPYIQVSIKPLSTRFPLFCAC